MALRKFFVSVARQPSRVAPDQILKLIVWAVAATASLADVSAQEVKPPAPEVKLDIYGAPLPPGAIARMGSAQWRQPFGGPRIMALSPDGKLLATTSFGPTIQLFDAQSGVYLRALPELVSQTITCTGLSFSPDGKSIVSGYVGGIIRWNDVAKGDELLVVQAEQGKWTGLAFSSGGRIMATWGEDQRIRVWDAVERKHVRDLTGFEGTIRCAGISADGRILAAVGRDDFLRFWDIDAGREIGNASIENFQPVALVFSSDGKRLALADQLERTEIWGVDARQRIGSLKGCVPITYSPTARILAVAHAHAAPRDPNGGIVLCEELGDEIRTREIAIPDALLPSLQFTPDGKTLLAGHDSIVDRFDVANGKRLHENHGHLGGVTGLAVSPDGQLVASTATDGTLIAWELSTGKEKWRLDGFPQDTRILGFSSDGQHLLFRTAGAIRVTDIATHQESKLILEKVGHIEAAAISPVGDLIAVGAKRAPIEIWNWKREEKLQTIPMSLHSSLTFSSDGKRLLSTGLGTNTLANRKNRGFDPSVIQWHPGTGERLLHDSRWPPYALAGTYSADDRYLGLACSTDAKFFDLNSAGPPVVIKAVDQVIHQVAFAARGRRVGIADGGALRVWDSPADLAARDGTYILRTTIRFQDVHCLQFSPSGELTVAGCNDGTLLVFQLR